MICHKLSHWLKPLLALLCLNGLVGVVWAEPLLLVDEKMDQMEIHERNHLEGDYPTPSKLSPAQLAAIGPKGKLHFQTSQGELAIEPTNLVRWSSPRDVSPASCLLLTDGGRLVFSEPWKNQPMITLSAGEVTVHSVCLGRPRVSRSQLRAIVLRGPAERGQYDRLLTQLLAWQGPGDQLHLVGGDRLAGRLIGIGRADPNRQDTEEPPAIIASAPPTVDLITFESEVGRVKIPRRRVIGVSLQPVPRVSDQALLFELPHQQVLVGKEFMRAPTPKDAVDEGRIQPAPTELRLGVGLRDGSWLVCDRLTGDLVKGSTHTMYFHLLAGLELKCRGLQEVVALQQLGSTAKGSAMVYLSDLEVDSYAHQPFLDIPWTYQIDHNVWGGRLRVKERIYPKGLGVHSTSRLIYRITRGWDRMVAQVAIDEVAGSRGSVLFRVELLRNGKWQEVYRSPIVRGGEPPRDLSVNLANAQQLALVTEYADRGDEWDDANWLDARLMR